MAIAEDDGALCNGTAHSTEECRVHPAKVRVKFIESQPLAQVTPPSPDVTLDFSDMTEEHYNRQISHETGIDNPFRPDGELSREADTIVSLIKEGKPIDFKGEDSLDGQTLTNGYSNHHASDMMSGPQSGQECREVVVNSTTAAEARSKGGSNGKTPAAPGVVEVQRGVIVPPSDAPQVEQVIIKKKSKCNCCVVQ